MATGCLLLRGSELADCLLLIHSSATIEVVRRGHCAVFPGFVWAGRANHDFIAGKVELQRRAPGIQDFALVVDFGPAHRENQHFFL